MFSLGFFRVLCLITLATFAGAVSAQTESKEEDPVNWTLSVKASGSASGRFVAELNAQIKKGWHLYSTDQIEGGPKPTRIRFPEGQPFKQDGEIDAPAPSSSFDPNFQIETEFYEDSVTFTVPFRSLPNAKAEGRLILEIRYQSCTQTLCLPPKLLKLEAPIQLGSSESKNATRESTAAAGSRMFLEPGAAVPDFSFTDFSGKPRRFAEFRGHYVLLDFWASWCGPCLADIPKLKELYAKYRNRKFEIVGMDSETLGQDPLDVEFAKSSQAQARDIVVARGVSWTQATTDSSVPVAVRVFGVTSLPVKILIDPSGHVVAQIKDLSELDKVLAGIFGK